VSRHDDPEHRRSQRVPIALGLEYRSAGAFLVAYSTNLSKGGLFVETSAPLPIGTSVTLRLKTPHSQACEVEGMVAWIRAEARGPGQPAGMGIDVETPPEQYGSVVDEIAHSFSGIQMLLGTGEPAPRAILSRYLRSILSCEVLDVDYARGIDDIPHLIDLAVIDLDSSGPSGDQLVRSLRQRPDTSTVPIIVLAQSERDRVRGHELGADEALTNPPLFAELQAAVVRSIAKPSTVS
jgi:uncharacterized protein (TIGR02266 family)